MAVATSRDGPAAAAAAAVAAVDCCGFGCVGSGQVTSAEFGWQNSRILSYKYHCLWMLRPGVELLQTEQQVGELLACGSK